MLMVTAHTEFAANLLSAGLVKPVFAGDVVRDELVAQEA